MQTARHSDESTRRVRWSNTQVLWAHSGSGEQDACKHRMIPCRVELCWVYATV
jgi:hypothetical protein